MAKRTPSGDWRARGGFHCIGAGSLLPMPCALTRRPMNMGGRSGRSTGASGSRPRCGGRYWRAWTSRRRWERAMLAEIVRAVRGLVTGVKRAPQSERGLDLYETPSVAVEALLRAEQLDPRIWEPCAGRGAIADVLRAHGHT